MALEHRLRIARREAGWSRAELSRRSGVSAQAIYLIESGRVVRPNVDTALGLAEALGRPAEVLFVQSVTSAPLEELDATGSVVASDSGIADDGTAVIDGVAKLSDEHQAEAAR